ncbi:MAG: glycosyltransferase family 4 protein, partial [Chloroflexi bacterium]
MSPRNGAPAIVFLKQTASLRHWFVELGVDLAAELGPSLMYTSVPTDTRQGALRILAAPEYRKATDLVRLRTWFNYFLRAIRLVWRMPVTPLLFIVAQPPYLPIIGYLRNLLLGQRYVVWIDDVYPDTIVRHRRLTARNPLVRLWRRLNRLMLSRAERVFTLGPCMAEVLRPYVASDTRGDRIVIVPTWVDADAIGPLPKD